MLGLPHLIGQFKVIYCAKWKEQFKFHSFFNGKIMVGEKNLEWILD